MSFMDSFNFKFTYKGRQGMINPLGVFIGMIILLVAGITMTGDESVSRGVVALIWALFALLTFLFVFCVVMVVRQMRKTSDVNDDVQTNMSYTLDDAEEKK